MSTVLERGAQQYATSLNFRSEFPEIRHISPAEFLDRTKSALPQQEFFSPSEAVSMVSEGMGVKPYDVHRLYDFARLNNVIEIKDYQFNHRTLYTVSKRSVELLVYMTWQ